MSGNDNASQSSGKNDFDIRSIIDPDILRMLQYKSIVQKEKDASNEEKKFQFLIRQCLDAMTNVAGDIDIPDDYVKVSVNGKTLYEFAFLHALPVFIVEGERVGENTAEMVYYAIDTSRRIAYINAIRVATTPDKKD